MGERMTLLATRAQKVAVAGACLALAVTACGGSGKSSSSSGPAGKKGGTLFLINDNDFDHIDPQRTYVGNALNVTERFLNRTLVTYRSVPGKSGSELVPDMATDLGRASDNNKTWKFTFKDGLKWQDGSTVTCADFKYGVSRGFAQDVITDGPTYAFSYLKLDLKPDGTPVYQGPYKAGSNGGFDDAVQCTDPKNIVFHLARSVGDFNYTVSLPEFAAVPKAKDTKAKYDNNVVSDGPYKIETYDRGKQLVLTRNKYWDPKTDTVRKAFPDKVVVKMGADPNVIDDQFINDTGDAKTGIQNSTQVQPQNLNRVLTNPALRKRAVNGYDGFSLYIAINQQKVKNLKVRQAIAYAVNLETFRGAFGGKEYGDYSTSFITPAVKSHKDFDVYGVKKNPKGDPAKAKQLLTEAGVKTPYPLRFDFRNRPATAKAAAAVQEALQRNGNFKVTLNPVPTTGYYATIGHHKTAGDIINSGWGPDWPNGSSVVQPLFNGPLASVDGSSNYSVFSDPTVDAMINKANQETDLDKAAKLWGDADEAAVKAAAAVPTLWSKTTQMYGSGVKGAFLHSFYGEIDVNALSVA
jgi:peptide/nickel transport system substrate-binding protein